MKLSYLRSRQSELEKKYLQAKANQDENSRFEMILVVGNKLDGHSLIRELNLPGFIKSTCQNDDTLFCYGNFIAIEAMLEFSSIGDEDTVCITRKVC